jgi:hypothetical protein
MLEVRAKPEAAVREIAPKRGRDVIFPKKLNVLDFIEL